MYAGYRGAALMLSSDMLTVTRITLAGNARLSDGGAVAAIRARGAAHAARRSGRVADEAPRVAVGRGMALRRVFPGGIDVVVSERQPMGIGHVGDALFLIDEVGEVMDESGPHAELDLPVINGLSGPGKRVRRADRQNRAALAARFLSSLRQRPDLAARVSEVDVSDAAMLW